MKKILIVDDEENFAKLMMNRLSSYGYDAVTAANGEEALTQAKAQKPDLILLDVALPKRNGYEVLEQLKQIPETRDIPVIMLTVYDISEEMSKAKALGAVDYITKPFMPENLFEKIKRFCPLNA